MQDPLDGAIRKSHHALAERFDQAAAAVESHAGRSDVTQKTDDFLIRACRHASAVCDVVLPVTRDELVDGRRRVREYVRQCRRLERATTQARRRLYGDSRGMGVPWSQMWSGLDNEFQRLNALERDLARDLAGGFGSGRNHDLARRLAAAESTGPTRAHPNSRHAGRFAHLSRRLWARADRFWDATQGRIMPADDQVPQAPATRLAR